MISAYYSIPAYADNLLVSQKLPENQLKDKLKAKIAEICTDPLLGHVRKWIDETSIYGTGFNEGFASLRLISAKKMINVASENTGNVKATYRINTKKIYSLATNLPTLDAFVSKFKVTNISQRELEELVNKSKVSEIVGLEVVGICDVTFTLVTTNGRLKIADVNQLLVSSTLVVHQN